MTSAQAAKLVAMLQAAYPRGPWPDETRALYQAELEQHDADLMGKSVQSAIRTCKFPPTIAELLEAKAEVRKLQLVNRTAELDERTWEERKRFELQTAPSQKMAQLIAGIGQGGRGQS